MGEQAGIPTSDRWRAFLGKARGRSATPAGVLEVNSARLLRFVSLGALGALTIGGLVGWLTLELNLPVYIAWITSFACFAAAPWVLRRTGSMAWGALLLLLGGAGCIFVPAYYQDGIRSPYLIWFAVIPMLAPLFFGLRSAIVATGVGILGFSALFAAEIFWPPAVSSTTAPAFFSYFNLLLAAIFGAAVGVATRVSRDRGQRDLEKLGQEFELRAELLQESHARRTAVLDASLSAIITCDAEGVVTDFNPAAEQLFGYSRSQAMGSRIRDLIVPEAMQRSHDTGFERYLATGSPAVLGRTLELVARCSDGSEIPVEFLVQRIDLPGPPQFTAFLRDLRPRRRAEALLRQRDEQLDKARRLEDVGRLAGGVAHDFNNLLTIIGGYGESILAEAKPGSPIREDAQEIVSASDRAAVITRQLLAFSRSQVLKLGAVDLTLVLESFATTLRTVVPQNVELVLRADPARWRVRGDNSQFERVFMNLAVNACDAMEGGGQLEIRLVYDEISKVDEGFPPDFKPGRYAQLEFRDSGSGMSKETLSHVFEPFFTTKEVGQGTGLGLASVYGIIQQCGGQIDIHSEPGQGTTVRIFLPEEVYVESEILSGDQKAHRSSDVSILVVEDDSSIRNLVASGLRLQSYHVLEAADGQEALAVAEQQGENLDLLITDLVLPSKSGSEVARAVHRAYPKVKFIFISGYFEDQVVENLPEAAVLLQKPLKEKVLLEAVEKLLDS